MPLAEHADQPREGAAAPGPPAGHPFHNAATVVFLTLDTLRFDVAQQAWSRGQTPNLAAHLPPTGWERRHTPATFTYAAHHAFFSGFLPTPPAPGPHPRLFASSFAGSESTDGSTYAFPHATLPEALSAAGWQTICIGGTGFFNPDNHLGRVLPSLFDESHWNPSLGVTDPASPRNQLNLAAERVDVADRPTLLFVNVAAIHQPNWFYRSLADVAPGDGTNLLTAGAGRPAEKVDDPTSHRGALIAVDQALLPLIEAIQWRGPSFWIVCADHGTAYGEGGHLGHRHAHPVVWDVPYTQFPMEAA